MTRRIRLQNLTSPKKKKAQSKNAKEKHNRKATTLAPIIPALNSRIQS